MLASTCTLMANFFKSATVKFSVTFAAVETSQSGSISSRRMSNLCIWKISFLPLATNPVLTNYGFNWSPFKKFDRPAGGQIRMRSLGPAYSHRTARPTIFFLAREGHLTVKECTFCRFSGIIVSTNSKFNFF